MTARPDVVRALVADGDVHLREAMSDAGSDPATIACAHYLRALLLQPEIAVQLLADASRGGDEFASTAALLEGTMRRNAQRQEAR